MEKLIELLNNPEFDPSSKIEHWTEISVQNCDYLIISKNRGFIRKLVEKDLIDFESMNWNGKIISYLTDVADYKRNDIKENLVLMLLSIQDDPIKYLISILK